MKPLIVFHKNCMDGSASALAAYLKFGDEAEYRPAQYGDAAPTDEAVRGRDMYILDFSYPRAELVRMAHAQEFDSNEVQPGQNRFIVLDHHKTAQADLAGLPFCTFDMNKSGAVLAWEHFNTPFCDGYVDPNGMMPPLPELFAYVQDRDLWRWELPHSREVSAALAASGALTDFRKLIPIYEGWPPSRFDKKIGDLVAEGAAILRAEKLLVERIAATAEEVEIGYLVIEQHAEVNGRAGLGKLCRVRALAVTSAVLQSEVGEALALESARRGRDAVGVVYYRDGAAGKWRVSLRSRDVGASDVTMSSFPGMQPAPDVSTVAKSFGGGGHAKAAGFECDELPRGCAELPWVRR